MTRHQRIHAAQAYPVPNGFPQPLVALLDRWIERRSGLFAKGFWPELKFVITLTPITWKQKRIAEGVCMERSSTPRPHDRIDELGYAVASLVDLERDLLILSRMGDIQACLTMIRMTLTTAMQNGWSRFAKQDLSMKHSAKAKGIKPHEVAIIDKAWWDYATAARRHGLP